MLLPFGLWATDFNKQCILYNYVGAVFHPASVPTYVLPVHTNAQSYLIEPFLEALQLFRHTSIQPPVYH